MSPPDLVRRFSGGQRLVHWSTAALLLVCLATAAVLYLAPLATLVGRRPLVAAIHLWAGLALPAPMLLGLLSAALRADLRLLDRFSPDDWRWLRSARHRAGAVGVGKFNAGQKLNASFTAGAVLVLLGTGIMLWRPDPWPVSLRTGATFVHDWTAAAVFVAVIGHLTYALSDRDALTGMLTGTVPRGWAARRHPAWPVDRAADPLAPDPRDADPREPELREV